MEGGNENPIIELNNISLHYETLSGTINVLEDINLKIYEQEFVCLLGASGCGKTSLLNIVAGFLKPSSGKAMHQNMSITGISWERGVVFQDANLFPWLNVRENVAFGLKMRNFENKMIKGIVDKALSQVGLLEYENKYIYELSGGMRQRVGIARILANDSKIVLMDEPFGSLDAITRESMQRLIRKIWIENKKTILFITHDVDEALMLGTRIIVLKGKPSTIEEDIKCDYTYSFEYDITEKEKYTEEYYEKKQKLIKKMSN